MHCYISRCSDSNFHLLTANTQHLDADVVVDADGFAYAAGEYLHDPTPWLISRMPLSEWHLVKSRPRNWRQAGVFR